MFEIQTFIGVLLLLILIILIATKRFKFTRFKIFVIGFLFGVSLMPFVMTLGLSYGLPLLNPLVRPGLYVSSLFYQDQPTRFAPALDKNGQPIPVEQLSEEAQEFISENPTTPQPTNLSKMVEVITDGVYYGLIFFFGYFFNF